MNISDLLKYPELKEIIDIYEKVKRVVNFYNINDPNIYEIELDIPRVRIPKNFTRRDLEYFKDEYNKLMKDFYEVIFEDINFDIVEQKDNHFKLKTRSDLNVPIASLGRNLFYLEKLLQNNIDQNISEILEYGKTLEREYKSFDMDRRYNSEMIEKIKERNERFKPIYEEKLKNLIKEIKRFHD
jgi:hypothetical protein